MLRIYFLPQWFNLSDPAVEEALYESLSMRQFAGIDLGREPAPETTVCKFRHLLEQHNLGRALFEQFHMHLAARGALISKGAIVDTTIRCRRSPKRRLRCRSVGIPPLWRPPG
jgi:transposase, IS5 family